jgi:mRNA interferase MazF
VKRAEVWWARYPPTTAQPHPVVLLSWDAGEEFRDQVTVAQVTSTIRGLDAEVRLDESDGLLYECVANLDAIATIPRSLLIERLCMLSGHRMKQIEVAVHWALGIPLPCEHGH